MSYELDQLKNKTKQMKQREKSEAAAEIERARYAFSWHDRLLPPGFEIFKNDLRYGKGLRYSPKKGMTSLILSALVWIGIVAFFAKCPNVTALVDLIQHYLPAAMRTQSFMDWEKMFISLSGINIYYYIMIAALLIPSSVHLIKRSNAYFGKTIFSIGVQGIDVYRGLLIPRKVLSFRHGAAITPVYFGVQDNKSMIHPKGYELRVMYENKLVPALWIGKDLKMAKAVKGFLNDMIDYNFHNNHDSPYNWEAQRMPRYCTIESRDQFHGECMRVNEVDPGSLGKILKSALGVAFAGALVIGINLYLHIPSVAIIVVACIFGVSLLVLAAHFVKVANAARHSTWFVSSFDGLEIYTGTLNNRVKVMTLPHDKAASPAIAYVERGNCKIDEPKLSGYEHDVYNKYNVRIIHNDQKFVLLKNPLIDKTLAETLAYLINEMIRNNRMQARESITAYRELEKEIR